MKCYIVGVCAIDAFVSHLLLKRMVFRLFGTFGSTVYNIQYSTSSYKKSK